MVNEDPPLIDRITIIVSIVILGLLILSIFICVLREDKKNEDESQFYDTQLAQWESPVLHYQVLGSMTGKYLSISEEQRGTIRCESTWKHLNKDGTILRGKAGEYGICQFMWDTFELFKRQSKKTDLSIYSASDQIELMTWAFEQGEEYKRHWTCWRDLYENN